MRQALVELVASRLGGIKPTAGSLRPLLETMTKAGLWIEGKVVLGGLHRQEADAASDTTLILVRLSQTGKESHACGVPRSSPNGSADPPAGRRAAVGAQRAGVRLGLSCPVAWYATTVCPETALPVAPDIGLTRRRPASRSGSGRQRTRRAPHGALAEQMALQGQVAICAISTEQRANLVAEAQAAGIEHGVATDLQTLLDTQKAASPLWAGQW